MLTVSEVCDRLKISKYTAYRLIKSGVIPATNVTGGRHKFLVNPADVEKMASDSDFIGGVPAEQISEGRIDLLTTDEVARIMRCSVETVRRLAGTGELKGVRNPGRNSHWRFWNDDVLEYLNSRPLRAEPQPAS